MTAAHRSLILMTVVGVAAICSTIAVTRFQFSPLVMTIAIVVILTGVMAATLQWWRTADEAVREAHKSAWFWGGMGGLMVLAPLLLYVGGNQHALLDRFTANGPYQLFAYGILATLAVELVGYTICWVWWWARRR